jgi:hypothetical protein
METPEGGELVARPYVNAKTLPRDQRRELMNTCLTKASYKQEAFARQKAAERQLAIGQQLYVYKCRHCPGFHLSRKQGPDVKA